VARPVELMVATLELLDNQVTVERSSVAGYGSSFPLPETA
jgi:hypothetical protein